MCKNTEFMHKLYSPIKCKGVRYITKISIEEYSNANKRLYHLAGIEIKSPVGRFAANSATLRLTSGSVFTVSDLFAPDKQYDKNFNPKSVNSHLVNENGTPKVLYHGTPDTFTLFDFMKNGRNGSQEGKGFCLTDNKELAQSYGEPMECMRAFSANYTATRLRCQSPSYSDLRRLSVFARTICESLK